MQRSFICVIAVVLVAKSCPALLQPVDCTLPGSSVHETPQARILEWVAVSFSRGSSRLRNRTCVSGMVAEFFTTEPPACIYVQMDYFFFSISGSSREQLEPGFFLSTPQKHTCGFPGIPGVPRITVTPALGPGEGQDGAGVGSARASSSP